MVDLLTADEAVLAWGEVASRLGSVIMGGGVSAEEGLIRSNGSADPRGTSSSLLGRSRSMREVRMKLPELP